MLAVLVFKMQRLFSRTGPVSEPAPRQVREEAIFGEERHHPPHVYCVFAAPHCDHPSCERTATCGCYTCIADNDGPRSLIGVHIGGPSAWFGLQSCLAGSRYDPDRDEVLRSESCCNGIALYLSQVEFFNSVDGFIIPLPRSPTIHIWRDADM